VDINLPAIGTHAFMKLKFLKSLWIFLLSPALLFDNSSAVAKSSGCGSGSSWYLLRIGSPIAANQFRVACNEHDACYDIFGKSKQECDKAFHNRMLGTCARDHNTWLGKPLKIACNGRADAYYTGVLENGQEAYDKAQEAAKPSSSEIEQPQASTDPTDADIVSTIELSKLCGRTVYLKSWKGDYLHRPDDNAQKITTWNPTFGSQWAIECLDNGKFRFRSWKRDYLHRTSDNLQKITAWGATPGSQWDIETPDSSAALIRSWKGDYLHRPDGNVRKITTWDPTLGSQWTIYLLR
jgi:Group XII secretory phospholipase A2 precursor (PLA2G12)